MKEFKNEQEAIEAIESENYYYRDGQFENYAEIEKAANNYFREITENDLEPDEEKEHYSKFGLEVGECHLEIVKTELFFNEEINATMKVYFVEGYIDPGVQTEDYFYGYFIEEYL